MGPLPSGHYSTLKPEGGGGRVGKVSCTVWLGGYRAGAAIGFTGVFDGWPMRTLGDVSARSRGGMVWVKPRVSKVVGLPFCPNDRTPRRMDGSGLTQ